MEITFIGTSTCTPDIDQEVASFVINNQVLVDTGWCNVLKMKEYGMPDFTPFLANRTGKSLNFKQLRL